MHALKADNCAMLWQTTLPLAHRHGRPRFVLSPFDHAPLESSNSHLLRVKEQSHSPLQQVVEYSNHHTSAIQVEQELHQV